MKLVKISAFVTIVALPLYVIRCKNFNLCVSQIPFTFLELLVLATFALWVIDLLRNYREKPLTRILEALASPLTLPAILFVFFATASLLVSSDALGGLGVWKAYFVEGMLFYLVVVDVSLREKDYFWVIKALFLSGVLVSAFSIYKLAFSINQGFSGLTALRISGLYEFANAVPLFLGPIIALTIGWLISIYKNSQRGKEFYFVATGLFLMIFAVILSQSKGGIVSLVFVGLIFSGLFLFQRLRAEGKKYLRYLAWVLIVVYFLLSIFVFINVDNLIPRKAFPSNSLYNRYCIWTGTKNLLVDKPIFGSGLNGFNVDYEYYKTTTPQNCLKSNYYYPHNLLVTLWVEVGLFGFLSFLWLSYNYVRMCFSAKDKILSVGLLGAMVYIFFHGLVDVPFFKNDLSIQFWIILALATMSVYKSNLMENYHPKRPQ